MVCSCLLIFLQLFFPCFFLFVCLFDKTKAQNRSTKTIIHSRPKLSQNWLGPQRFSSSFKVLLLVSPLLLLLLSQSDTEVMLTNAIDMPAATDTKVSRRSCSEYQLHTILLRKEKSTKDLLHICLFTLTGCKVYFYF